MANFIPVKVEKLELDKQNPRFPERLLQPDIKETDVLNWMLEDATLIDLIASISSNGFFPGEPIIAIMQGGDSFTVIEGNRRLAAVKLLRNPHLSDINTKTISKLSETATEHSRIPDELYVYIADKREDVEII